MNTLSRQQEILIAGIIILSLILLPVSIYRFLSGLTHEQVLIGDLISAWISYTILKPTIFKDLFKRRRAE